VIWNKAACLANRKQDSKQLFYFDKRISWSVTKLADSTIKTYLPFTSTGDAKVHTLRQNKVQLTISTVNTKETAPHEIIPQHLN
jgi:hypothetical protein